MADKKKTRLHTVRDRILHTQSVNFTYSEGVILHTQNLAAMPEKSFPSSDYVNNSGSPGLVEGTSSVMAKGITPRFGSLAFVRWSPIQRKMEICFLGKRIERLG